MSTPGLIDWLRRVAPRRKEGQANDFALFDMANLNLQELNAKINEAADMLQSLSGWEEALRDAKFCICALEAQLIGFAPPTVNVAYIVGKIDEVLPPTEQPDDGMVKK